LPHDDLNIPNFIEICLEKAISNNSNNKSQQQNNVKPVKNKSELFLSLLSEKRVLLKFGPNRIFLQETDEKPIEQEYKNVLYLNNSITNENFFCLAYANDNKSLVNALILYSDDVELIDDVIREYAVNVSSELNVIDNNQHQQQTNSSKKTSPKKFSPFDKISLTSGPKVEQHTCILCPMQQFIELCDYLKVEI
jgi:hypothetical protein